MPEPLTDKEIAKLYQRGESGVGIKKLTGFRS